MELQTKRLKIIPCTNETLSSISASEEYQVGSHITMYLEALKEDASLLGWGVWFVIDKDNDTVIGDIGFKGKPDSENTIEVGYGIVPSLQGKGCATEAVKEIILWAFTSNSVKRITAECENNNVASIRVLEKLGFNRLDSEKNMLKWLLER
ncbi:GNAT family N-acetyltransferase [Gracilibacillus lacisalsi]|uniref:GNAT family N-acetyltransferase n=1 Tax=Gracilibacillus lacisalsi TaxID=393087 RepID=UPI000362AE73|nr:GNAT family N-acetyltransferase [Gracilibacillus lacisalsi]